MTEPTPTCLIARQPILNRREETVSYELLFRSMGSRGAAAQIDPSFATASVVLNTLSAFGMNEVLGRHRGFINVELEFLLSDAIELLPRDRVVLELLETLQVTPELIQRCAELKAKGFTLAIDDHRYDVAYAELYGIASIVKIDLMQTSLDELDEMVLSLRRYPVQLLAEKVETRAEFEHCLALGFEYFQGYYFAKPTLLEKRRIDEPTSTLLKLVRQLSDDVDVDELEQSFRRSPGLTYKLLQLVNSVLVGARVRVSSIRHAISMLGRRQLQRWAQLAVFASDDSTGSMNPLVELAAVRACFLEHLAICSNHRGTDREHLADEAFMVGILSLLENIYHVPLDSLVSDLNLSPDVSQALTGRVGVLGGLLQLAETLDQTYGSVDAERLAGLGVSEQDVFNAQLRAYQWLGAAA